VTQAGPAPIDRTRENAEARARAALLRAGASTLLHARKGVCEGKTRAGSAPRMPYRRRCPAENDVSKRPGAGKNSARCRHGKGGKWDRIECAGRKDGATMAKAP